MQRIRRAALFAALGVVCWPGRVSANFVWAPALYVYSYAVWWVVVTGLLIEGAIYYAAWRRDWLSTAKLTLGVNLASALGGALWSYASYAFLRGTPETALAFVWSFPLLVYLTTVALEYLTGTRMFSLPRSRRTAVVVALANVPSVGVAMYATAELAVRGLRGGA